ncbi:MAG: hypothetical protein ACYDC6_12490 [Acidobacteriaceae bacterium]
MTARTEAATPDLPICAETGWALLHAVLAALPVLRSDRSAAIEAATLLTFDGKTDETKAIDLARPYVAEYDRVIALCEGGLQKAGLR